MDAYEKLKIYITEKISQGRAIQEAKAFERWEIQSRDIAAHRDTRNDIIESRADLRESGMDSNQIDNKIRQEFAPTLASTEIERGSPLWNAAWNGLSKAITADRLGDGRDLSQFNRSSGSFEDWQHLGARVTPTEVLHQFRHRDHPVTHQREYREISTPRLSPNTEFRPDQQLKPERGLKL